MKERLTRCFLATFPELAHAEIDGASVETVASWDSLHTVVLAAVLEESFGVRVPARDYPLLRSFASVHDYLQRRLGASGYSARP